MSGVIEGLAIKTAHCSEDEPIDLTITGTYHMGKGADYSGDFWPFQFIAAIENSAGVITTGAAFSIGTNHPACNNIVAAGVINPGVAIPTLPILCQRIDDEADVYFKVTAGATGISPVLTARPLLQGYGWSPS